jgi:hypothetical protein
MGLSPDVTMEAKFRGIMSEEEGEEEEEDWWRRATMAIVEEAAGRKAVAFVEAAKTPEADLFQALLRVASMVFILLCGRVS